MKPRLKNSIHNENYSCFRVKLILFYRYLFFCYVFASLQIINSSLLIWLSSTTYIQKQIVVQLIDDRALSIYIWINPINLTVCHRQSFVIFVPLFWFLAFTCCFRVATTDCQTCMGMTESNLLDCPTIHVTRIDGQIG